MNTNGAIKIESERPRLLAIATRILGTESDAEDVVQAAWLRMSKSDDVRDPAAWLTTVVTRLCLDLLRRQGTRSKAEVAAARSIDISAPGPEDNIIVADQVGGALQVVFDSLTPPERAAFVLHEVFGYPFDEISFVLGRSGTAVRQLASRARRKVSGTPESVVDVAASAESHQVVEAFLAAARSGEMTQLLELLAPDAFMQVDERGQKMGVPPLFDGAESVAERFNGAQGADPVLIDGELAAAWMVHERAKVAFLFHVDGGLIREVELIADPEVLATMDVSRWPSG